MEKTPDPIQKHILSQEDGIPFLNNNCVESKCAYCSSKYICPIREKKPYVVIRCKETGRHVVIQEYLEILELDNEIQIVDECKFQCEADRKARKLNNKKGDTDE